ncbi:MAG: hypothetical protein WC650_03920 [Candidatus Doudnabacteria bacterium]
MVSHLLYLQLGLFVNLKNRSWNPACAPLGFLLRPPEADYEGQVGGQARIKR